MVSPVTTLLLSGCRKTLSILPAVLSLFLLYSQSPVVARKYCDEKNPLVTKACDSTCAKDFIFCVPGIGGIPAQCPEHLVFNPKRENCDIPKACTEIKEVDRTCVGKPCGLNADPGCETYFICSGGNKIKKKCPEGFFFDTEDKECQDPAEEEVICFDDKLARNLEPTDIQNDTSWSIDDSDYCVPHDYKVSTGAAADNAKNGPGIILEAPKVTDWGNWNEWSHCPKGTYTVALSVWKRSVEDDRKRFDHGGVVSVGFRCEDPLDMKKQKDASVIGQCAKDSPDDSWGGWLECEDGAVVGFQLSQQEDQKEKDDTATDNIKTICSCGKEKEKFKPYHLKKPAYNKVGNQKGEWTEAKYCNKKQALCGFKTQMQDWVQTNIVKLEKEDMTALNQMHTKCCDVPSPGICAAKETLMYIETCDNTESKSARPCMAANILVGVAYNDDEFEHSISFYTSIGYKIAEELPVLRKSVESNVECKGECEANYQKLDEKKIWRLGNVTAGGEVTVQPTVNGKVHQVVVKCGIFKVYTNTLIVKGKKKDGKEATPDSFIF